MVEIKRRSVGTHSIFVGSGGDRRASARVVVGSGKDCLAAVAAGEILSQCDLVMSNADASW